MDIPVARIVGDEGCFQISMRHHQHRVLPFAMRWRPTVSRTDREQATMQVDGVMPSDAIGQGEWTVALAPRAGIKDPPTTAVADVKFERRVNADPCNSMMFQQS